MSPQDEQATARKERAWHEWMMITVGLTGLLSLMAIVISAVALSSSSRTTTVTTVAAAPVRATQTAATVAPQSLTVKVKADAEHGRMGPDKQWHDAFLPADFTVHAGATIHVTVINYDGGPHTFTAPSMNVNAIIPGGGSMTAPRTTTFTFTAPSRPGRYQWWCAVPCDPWAMSHDGYMRGYVTVAA